jgi:GntR family transcriptional regulator
MGIPDPLRDAEKIADEGAGRSVPLFRIDRLDKLPLYEQIERNLRELILKGRLQPGETVPSEWELSGRYGVSRLTVRRALDDLVRQDWLIRRQGVGTFVSRPVVAAISPSQLSFTQEMLAIGRRPSSRLLSSRILPADQTAAQRLSLAEGDALVEITRLRLADDVPILHETAYLSSQRFPGLEEEPTLENGSLYECLHLHYGVMVARVDQTLKAVLLDLEQAKILGTQPGLPSIYTECVAYTTEGEAVEYSFSVAHNENSQFYFSFRRGES